MQLYVPNDIRETQDRIGYGRKFHPIRQKSDDLFIQIIYLFIYIIDIVI